MKKPPSAATFYILVLMLLVLVIELVRSTVGTFSIVEGKSMFPTFYPNDVVQARVMFDEPNRGSVVLVDDKLGGRALKRVVGLPGDKITLYKGFVYIGQQRLKEPYLQKNTYTFPNEKQTVFSLGPTEYFVLGDNRNNSVDSRSYGPLDRKQILRLVKMAENMPNPGFVNVMLPEPGKIFPRKLGTRSRE